MRQQQLSPHAQAVVEAINALPLNEQSLVVSFTAAGLTAKIAEQVSSASTEARTEASSSVVTSIAALTVPGAPTSIEGRFEKVKRHQSEEICSAIAGTVIVSGKQLDTLLSEGSFNLSREDQLAYAKELGYRLATRKEHEAYVDSLLAKEDAGTINDAEKKALKTYRVLYVRDDQGGLDVDGRSVFASDIDCGWYDDHPDVGVLFVRLSAEQK